ncbi:MAG: Dethiobiotin synthetase [Cyanobacteria bacterium P01_H01_bin.58]
MDFATARRFLIAQAVQPVPGQVSFIQCLRQGAPPVPGQVTSILLALKTVTQTLAHEPTLERSLAHAFFVLTYESRQLYLQGQQSGVDWPPLLSEDLTRIAEAVQTILAQPLSDHGE